jgi:uncharacterized membrane protein
MHTCTYSVLGVVHACCYAYVLLGSSAVATAVLVDCVFHVRCRVSVLSML